MTHERIYARAQAAFGRSGGGGYDLLNVDDGTTHRLDGTAARLWEVLGEPATAAVLASVLRDECGAPAEVAARDATAFLEALAAAGLVEWA